MLVVADATPLHYLVLIHRIELLPALFADLAMPPAVRAELVHPSAPAPVRQWALTPPTWITCLEPPDGPALPAHLGPGERDALWRGTPEPS